MELSLEEETLIDSYVDELLGTPYTILQFLKSNEHVTVPVEVSFEVPLCPSIPYLQL
jgi:hypothetical protein